jgi:hypothetical protein
MRKMLILLIIVHAGCGTAMSRFERELFEWERRNQAWEAYHRTERTIKQTPREVDPRIRRAFLAFQRRYNLYAPKIDPDVISAEELQVGRDYLYCPRNGDSYRIRVIYSYDEPMDSCETGVKWRRVFDDGRLGWLESSRHLSFRKLSSHESP